MHNRIGGRPALVVFVLSLVTLFLGGCGGGPRRGSLTPTSRSFIVDIEHECGVVYYRPSVKGEGLGFKCGKTASGAHVAATFTRRLQCSFFMTLIDTDRDRFQQCLSSPPHNPRGVVLCENNYEIFAVRTSPQTQSGTVRLSTGRQATSPVLVLNARARERWGGFFFDVLASRIPASAVLIEHGQAGRILGHLSLAPVPQCRFARQVR